MLRTSSTFSPDTAAAVRPLRRWSPAPDRPRCAWMSGRPWHLLPQAHGVEGLGALPDALEADHLAAPEGPHVEVAELGGCAASVPDAALNYRGGHAVPRVDDLLDLHREAGPGLEKAPHVLPET